MIHARLPQHVAAAHALEPAQHVLQRVIECVTDMERTRHIWRRDHDREGLGLAALGPAGLESTFCLPGGRHAGFDIGGLVGLFDHDGAITQRRKKRSGENGNLEGFTDSPARGKSMHARIRWPMRVSAAARDALDLSLDNTLDHARQVVVEPGLQHRPQHLLHEVFQRAGIVAQNRIGERIER